MSSAVMVSSWFVVDSIFEGSTSTERPVPVLISVGSFLVVTPSDKMIPPRAWMSGRVGASGMGRAGGMGRARARASGRGGGMGRRRVRAGVRAGAGGWGWGGAGLGLVSGLGLGSDLDHDALVEGGGVFHK